MDITSFLLGYESGKTATGGGDSLDEVNDILDEINGEVVGETLYTVTFIGADGAKLGEVYVYEDDDCPDPVKNKTFAKPTKVSTAQYDFTHSGWSFEMDGEVDSSALRAIEGDRTVYAVFTPTVRSYTVSFYDEDGITALGTEVVDYGSVPSGFTPTKDDYDFVEWLPALAAVTGETSYTAVWKEKPKFETGTWAEISSISRAGKAAEYFAVGQTRTEQITIDGVQCPVVLKIVGINHDTTSDGETIGLSIMMFTVPATKYAISAVKLSGDEGYPDTELFDTVQEVGAAFPTELRNVVRKVAKQYNQANKTYTGGNYPTFECYFWIPSSRELNGEFVPATNFIYKCGEWYEAFHDKKWYAVATEHKVVDTSNNTVNGPFWLRDLPLAASGYIGDTFAVYSDGAAAIKIRYGVTQSIPNKAYLAIGFCV